MSRTVISTDDPITVKHYSPNKKKGGLRNFLKSVKKSKRKVVGYGKR